MAKFELEFLDAADGEGSTCVIAGETLEELHEETMHVLQAQAFEIRSLRATLALHKEAYADLKQAMQLSQEANRKLLDERNGL